MKLLFDQNLSPRLVPLMAALFPASAHVQNVGLDEASDERLWEFAKNNDFVIVSKDEDFSDLSVLKGTPPKVIWLQMGNCTTRQIADALSHHQQEILRFGDDPDAGIFLIY